MLRVPCTHAQSGEYFHTQTSVGELVSLAPDSFGELYLVVRYDAICGLFCLQRVVEGAGPEYPLITAARTFKTMYSLHGDNSFCLSLVSKILNGKGDGVGFDNFTLIVGENATSRHICHSQHSADVTRLEAHFLTVRQYIEQTAMVEFMAENVTLIRVKMLLGSPMICSNTTMSKFPVPNGWNSLINDHSAHTHYGGEFKLAHDCVTWICKQSTACMLNIDFN